MKGPRYLKSLAYFCLIGLHVMIVNGLTAEELLHQKEGELRKFVDVVEENARTCDGLVGCSNSGDGCSRLDCYNYGIQDDSNYQCLGVANNSICGSQCKERNFDFTKGFVGRVDTANNHIAPTVCIHRTLDVHFKNSSINDSSHLFRVFFGAVDGTTRIYPGVDEDCKDVYDPRVRPWFLESTYVPKGVTVLIDSGLSMRKKPVGGDTYLSTAITTALKVLETLREGTDYVNIMCFDGDGTKPPNAKSSIYYKNLLYQSFSDNLAQIANSESRNSPSPINTSSAIDEAISELTSNSSPIPAGYLKVVIVLTGDQQFQTLSELNISSSSVNLFMYSFLNKDQKAECINSTIRASSEGIPVERIDNPLYALQSYYSFLAKIHRSFMRNQTDYGQKYEDASGIDDHTLTLSRAAFGPTGELLGVVGIDFFEEKVEEQYKPMPFTLIVESARHKSDPTNSFNAAINLNTIFCFKPSNACTGRSLDTGVDGICQETKGDAKIGCCGKCKAKNAEWGKILGGVAAGIGVLLAVAAILYCNKSRIARRFEEGRSSTEIPHFTFPGPEHGIVLQGNTTGNSGLNAPG